MTCRHSYLGSIVKEVGTFLLCYFFKKMFQQCTDKFIIWNKKTFTGNYHKYAFFIGNFMFIVDSFFKIIITALFLYVMIEWTSSD